MESNDSPEIPDRGETSDIPSLPSGVNARGHLDKSIIYYCCRLLVTTQGYMSSLHLPPLLLPFKSGTKPLCAVPFFCGQPPIQTTHGDQWRIQVGIFISFFGPVFSLCIFFAILLLLLHPIVNSSKGRDA